MWVFETQSEEAHDARTLLVAEFRALPKYVTKARRLCVETDIPAEVHISHFDDRLNCGLDRQKMCDPSFDNLRQRCQSLFARREIEREIELIAPFPIGAAVFLVQHIDRSGSWQPQHGNERRQWRVAG